MENSFKYFENRDCKYYPCHDIEHINCMFCYCPLLSIKECGGNPVWMDNGNKDCSQCVYPHKIENYGVIMKKLTEHFYKNLTK